MPSLSHSMITRVSRFTWFWRRIIPLCWMLPGLLMAAPGSILWTLAAPRVVHGPVLGIDGTLYVIATSGEKNQLMALSEQDGQVRWSVPLSEPILPAGDPWETLSAGPDGTVYISSGNSLLAYDAAGGFLFRHTTAGATRVSIPCIGPSGNLYIALFIRLNQQQQTLLRCLSAKGSLLWSVDAGVPGEPVAPPFLDGDGSLYLYSDRGLSAFASLGIRRWEFALPGRLLSCSFVLGTDGTVFYIDNNQQSFRSTGVYALDPLSLHPYGRRKWYEPLAASFTRFTSAAMGPGGILYCMIDFLSLGAFASDGTRLWTFELHDPAYNPAFAVGHDGTIYFLSSTQSDFHAIGRNGRLRWSRKLYGGGSPVISKSGAIYFTATADSADGDRLWAIDTGVTSLTHPWPLPRGDYRRSGRSPVVQPSDRFSRSRILPDSRLELLIEGPPSHLYSIERSATMKDWHSFTNGASSNGVVQFLIPAPASSPANFFRVAKP